MISVRRVVLTGVVLGGTVCLAVEGLLAQPTFPVAGTGEGGIPGYYHSRHQMSDGAGLPGDTVWVRHVIQNVGDSTITINALPCGVRLHGDLEFRHLEGPDMCPPERRALAPGDTVWSETAYEILSGPGQYMLTLRHAHPAQFGDQPDVGGFGFTVFTLEEAERFAGRMRAVAGLPLPVVYYVLEFTADVEAEISDDDVSLAVATVLRERGYTAIQLGRVAAQRLLPSPYLLVVFEAGPRGDYQETLRWIWDEGTEIETPDLPGYGECRVSDSGVVVSPVGLGAMIAMNANALVDQHVYGVCPPPGR